VRDQRFLRTTRPWAVIPLVYSRTFYTDLDDLRLLRTFGEHQMMAQLRARRLLGCPLINKEFRVCHPLLARGNVASGNLNHQKCARATKF
jgi:hypothetical protein